MSKAKKVLLWNYHIVLIERDLFKKTFKSAGQDNYILWVYPEFTSEISLVIPLDEWFTLGDLAADKKSILNLTTGRKI